MPTAQALGSVRVEPTIKSTIPMNKLRSSESIFETAFGDIQRPTDFRGETADGIINRKGSCNRVGDSVLEFGLCRRVLGELFHLPNFSVRSELLFLTKSLLERG